MQLLFKGEKKLYCETYAENKFNNRYKTLMDLKHKLSLKQQKVFEKEGIEAKIVHIGNKDIRGCMACGGCYQSGGCVFNDEVNEVAKEFEQADGLVVGSPVYYASANATLIAMLDRLFHSTRFDKRFKVGASVSCARRGGITTTHDQLNKYFTISGMPIASGQYWNGLHGGGERTVEDEEGIQQMQTLAINMAFLMKSIDLGKEKYGLPEKQNKKYTNFIR
jgi:multimeric flavodoxin WrbA